MTLELGVLGPLEAHVDGRPVALGGRKQRALLALLLLHANEVVSAERLIEEVWRTSTVAAATRSLHVYVSNLRKLLGVEASRLETRPGGYALAVEPHRIDAVRCAQLVDQGRQARAAGDLTAASAALRDASALWRGPPLADLAYESFVQVERGRLDELRLSVLEERIETELALGRHAELVVELEALAQEHPLRERVRGQLMLALYRSGRQQEALETYTEARRLLREEFGLEPTPDLRALQLAILRQEPDLSVEPAELRERRHLPAPATPLVGRRRELDQLRSMLLDDGARLVTITGAGGVGKTRLGLQAASDLAAHFDDGVYFVDLAPLRDPELVVSTVATALGVGQRPGTSLEESVKQHLARRRVLLLLDNFEQVDAAAPIVSDLLRSAPPLQVIVTSRSRLRLYGEHELGVAPLPLPNPHDLSRLDKLAEADALALFLARARAVDRSFRLTRANARELVELCSRLDGLPLAIELAASRAGEIPPDRMIAELPLSLAAQGPRDSPARHRALRATVEWSDALLARTEQRLFRHLAVFAGGWSEEAAVTICDADPESLRVLTRASLVRETRDEAGGLRYSMLETIRSYAAERVEGSAEHAELRRRHAEFFAVLAEGLQPLREARLGRIEADHDNVRSALTFVTQADDRDTALRLCAATWRLWYVRGLLSEGSGHIERALAGGAGDPADPRRAAVLRAASVLAWARGDADAAAAFAQRSLDTYTAIGDRVGVTRALLSLGIATQARGQLTEARTIHERSRRLAEELDLPIELGAALANLGDVALLEGDDEGARALYVDSLELCRRSDDVEGSAIALLYLGVVALRCSDPASAAAHFGESLGLFAGLRFTERISACLTGLAAAEVDASPDRAARLIGAAHELRTEVSARSEAWWEDEVLASTSERAESHLGRRRYEEEFASGRTSPGATIGDVLERLRGRTA